VNVYFKAVPPPTMTTIKMVMGPGASGSMVAPDGSTCYFDGTNPSTCSVDVAVGSQVTFTAQPSLGNVASSWTSNCYLNPDWTTCLVNVELNTNPVGVQFMRNPCIPGQTFMHVNGNQCLFNWQDGNYYDTEISKNDWTGKTPDECAQLCVTTTGCVVASYCNDTVTYPGYQNTCVLRNAASAFRPSSQYPQDSGISSWVNPAPLLPPGNPDETNGSLPPP
jgi:hypothetical protein